VPTKILCRQGLCETLVSDGGPPFNSRKFTEFCTDRGIKHVLSPPYHPQSNGLAEKSVQVFKNFAKKKHYIQNPTSTHTEFLKEIINFLFAFRNTPNSVTRLCPSELFLKSKCKTLLTNLNPKYSTNTVQEKVKIKKQFHNGQNVYIKVQNDGLINWRKGRIVCPVSDVVYKVFVNGNEKNCHVDHIRSCDPKLVPNLPAISNAYYQHPTPAPVQNNSPVTPENNVPHNVIHTPENRNNIAVSPATPVSPLNPVPQPVVQPIPQGVRRSLRERMQPRRLNL
jgi:hypothetical protein